IDIDRLDLLPGSRSKIVSTMHECADAVQLLGGNLLAEVKLNASRFRARQARPGNHIPALPLEVDFQAAAHETTGTREHTNSLTRRRHFGRSFRALRLFLTRSVRLRIVAHGTATTKRRQFVFGPPARATFVRVSRSRSVDLTTHRYQCDLAWNTGIDPKQ